MTQALEGAYIDPAVNYQAPATGATIPLADIDAHLIINPAGTLAALTVQMCPIPFEGQFVEILCTRAVTAFTLAPNAGQLIANGAPTSLVAGKRFGVIYRAADTTWYVGS